MSTAYGKTRSRFLDRSRDIEEQLGELEILYADQLRWERYRRAAKGCPPHRRAWLMEVSLRSETNWLDDMFMEDAARVGVVRAAIISIDQADADAKDRRRRWDIDRLSADRKERFEWLMEGLSDSDEYWCGISAKWISRYAPDRQTAIAVLTELLLNEKPLARWFAALQLARMAPETPRLVEVLCEAVEGEWIASSTEFYDTGIRGSGAAARALARLGRRASAALPFVREAFRRNASHKWDDDGSVFVNAYLFLGGNRLDLEAPALLPTVERDRS